MVLAPVIAIDGPSASGKGTVARAVAGHLGYHYLDSGAIYRALAVAACEQGAADDALAALATRLDLRFEGEAVLLSGRDATAELRSEATGVAASRLAVLPAVRKALLQRQRDFRQPPGLVADGRDMGTVVFPDAVLKVFLSASVEERARRRTAQLAAQEARAKSPKGLIEKENNAMIAALFDSLYGAVLADLAERDRRDSERAAAPLVRAEGARVLDTTGMSIDASVQTVLDWAREVRV